MQSWTWFLAAVFLQQAAREVASSPVVSKLQLQRAGSDLDPRTNRSVHNVQYYGAVAVGTPPRSFTVCIDTGSADFWLPNYLCSDRACLSHQRYDPQASTTATDHDYTVVQLLYGRGLAYGTSVFDTVSIGDPAVITPRQGVGAMDKVSSNFANVSCDGFYGLAFPSISRQPFLPPFFTMLQQNLLAAPQFSVWLNPDPDSQDAGEVIFGGLDPTAYTGSLQTVPLSRDRAWQVSFDGASVGGVELSLQANEAMLDTGTSAIVMSDFDALAINGAIQQLSYDSSIGAFTIDCSSIAQLPELTFRLGGIAFSLPPSAWITSAADAVAGASHSQACTSSILGGATDPTLMILGHPFLQHWYSVYNYDAQQSSVALAPSVARPGRLDSGEVETAGR